MVIISSK